jgi:DNA-binding NarL/FixJ family response regulator
VTERTVKAHVKQIFLKLELNESGLESPRPSCPRLLAGCAMSEIRPTSSRRAVTAPAQDAGL